MRIEKRGSRTGAALFLLIGAVSIGVVSFPGCQKMSGENGAKAGGAEQANEVGNKDAVPASNQEEPGTFGDWAADTWNGAVNGGAQTAQDTGQWISEMYQSAKDQGITSANSVKEWVADDWNAQGDWQYRLLTLDPSDAEQVEKKLNDAGADRWDCYHVDTTGSEWIFFMKRSRRSYLSRVPLKDLANMLPGASGESGE